MVKVDELVGNSLMTLNLLVASEALDDAKQLEYEVNQYHCQPEGHWFWVSSFNQQESTYFS